MGSMTVEITPTKNMLPARTQHTTTQVYFVQKIPSNVRTRIVLTQRYFVMETTIVETFLTKTDATSMNVQVALLVLNNVKTFRLDTNVLVFRDSKLLMVEDFVRM
jgi:hypothetical protein